MGGGSRVRWYQRGFQRWGTAISCALLGLGSGAGLIFQAVTVPADHAELIPGIAAPVIAAIVVTLQLRAGLGAGPEYLIVRNAGGGTRKIPWTSITRFEIWSPPGWRGSTTITVVCADGRRRYTSGCTTGPWIRQSDREMIRTLEAERTARTHEGAAPISLSAGRRRTGVSSEKTERRLYTGAAARTSDPLVAN